MSIIPKIEKVVKDTTISHFLLMFGYKIFAIYFPLFLIAKGFSLPEVGYIYLLIYLPIALFSPLVGWFCHKINPAILATVGILGYGIYALGMILIPSLDNFIFNGIFYFWQILLGISASLFFVSMKIILMSSSLENPDRAFGWFYTAPYYADAIAPAIGALFIWKFNFIGVFIFSLIIQIFTAIFCFSRLKKSKIRSSFLSPTIEKVKFNYQKIFQIIKNKDILFPIIISLSVLLLSGFYRSFFVLSLKDVLSWSQSSILLFVSVFSILFLPISLLIIKYLGNSKSEKNIFQGGITVGISSILFGVLLPVLNFFSILLINLSKSVGSLITNSSRSGLLSRELKENIEEAGAIDTIFSPFGAALGALISGVLIGFLGYNLLFIFGGIFVVLVSLVVKKLAKR